MAKLVNSFWGSSTLLDDLIGYWKLDETSGTTAYDAMTANDGTNTNCTVNQTGQIDKAYLTQVAAARVIVSTSSGDFDFGSGAFSVSCWADVSGGGLGEWFVNRRDATYHDWQIIRFSGNLEVYIHTDGSNYLKATITEPTFTAWNHLAFTYDGSGNASGLKLYHNDTLLSTTNSETGTYTGMGDNATQIVIGAEGFSGTYDRHPANMDEVKIWGRELTADEVSEDYDNGDAGDPLF